VHSVLDRHPVHVHRLLGPAAHPAHLPSGRILPHSIRGHLRLYVRVFQPTEGDTPAKILPTLRARGVPGELAVFLQESQRLKTLYPHSTHLHLPNCSVQFN